MQEIVDEVEFDQEWAYLLSRKDSNEHLTDLNENDETKRNIGCNIDIESAVQYVQQIQENTSLKTAADDQKEICSIPTIRDDKLDSLWQDNEDSVLIDYSKRKHDYVGEEQQGVDVDAFLNFADEQWTPMQVQHEEMRDRINHTRKMPNQLKVHQIWKTPSVDHLKHVLDTWESNKIAELEKCDDESAGIKGIIAFRILDTRRFHDSIWPSNNSEGSLTFFPETYVSEAQKPKNTFLAQLKRKGFEYSARIVDDLSISSAQATGTKTVTFLEDIRLRHLRDLLAAVANVTGEGSAVCQWETVADIAATNYGSAAGCRMLLDRAIDAAAGLLGAVAAAKIQGQWRRKAGRASGSSEDLVKAGLQCLFEAIGQADDAVLKASADGADSRAAGSLNGVRNRVEAALKGRDPKWYPTLYVWTAAQYNKHSPKGVAQNKKARTAQPN